LQLPNNKPECIVIKEFAAELSLRDNRKVRIDRWPDNVNSKSEDIDALAGRYAIEHTSLDTVPMQRQASAYFMKAVGDLERDLKDSISFRLTITIPYDGVKKGQDWPGIKAKLRDWIVNDAPKLKPGSYDGLNVPGVPFQLHVQKKIDRPPGLFFIIYAPPDQDRYDHLREQLDRKSHKLKAYQKKGKRTILLLETTDIALMETEKLADTIKKFYGGNLPDGVDEIWLADNTVRGKILFRQYENG
jgi:hypothetical protein